MTASGTEEALEARFQDHLAESGWLSGERRFVVAVSGGLDSMTLLYLMRFSVPVPAERLEVAHLDHRTRPGSEGDAAWVRGVCTAWGLSCHVRRSDRPMTTEEEGRAARYAFFEEIRSALPGEPLVVTGHTADDQSETVLFRIARGSGPVGLRGIWPETGSGVIRPLLPFWRSELAAFAGTRRVPFREDPSNVDLRWVRNRLRGHVLPALEDAVPGAKKALAALAGTSRQQAEALDQLLDGVLEAVAEEPAGPDEIVLRRSGLVALSEPVLTLLLRHVAGRMGSDLGRRGTADLTEFAGAAPSGRAIELPGGVEVDRSLDRIRIRRRQRASTEPNRVDSGPLQVDNAEGGGALALGAWTVDGVWGSEPRAGFPFVASFYPDDVAFPLSVRPWAPGDRVLLPYGKKKVKKILLEARIPAERRASFPVLADARGVVLWVPGMTDLRADPDGGGWRRPFFVQIRFPYNPSGESM